MNNVALEEKILAVRGIAEWDRLLPFVRANCSSFKFVRSQMKALSDPPKDDPPKDNPLQESYLVEWGNGSLAHLTLSTRNICAAAEFALVALGDEDRALPPLWLRRLLEECGVIKATLQHEGVERTELSTELAIYRYCADCEDHRLLSSAHHAPSRSASVRLRIVTPLPERPLPPDTLDEEGQGEGEMTFADDMLTQAGGMAI